MSSPARVAAKEPAGEAWRRLIGAASLTGAASLAGAALSIAATKVFAAMLGPSEIAVLSTLQQVRQAGVIGATLNGQTALVQGLSARGGEGDQAWRSFLRTSLLLIGAAGAAVSAILMTAPEWIARWSGIGPERTTLVRWLAAPVVLTCALVVWSAILNARRQTGRLALVQLAAPAAMALLAYPAARAAGSGNESALLGWLAAAPACAALAALAVGASKPWWCGGGGRWWNRRDASVFLTVSGSLLAGGAAGSLALLGARARILHQQGFAAAGEFDAAWAISMNHVSVLLGSLQTYCLPELARACSKEVRTADLRRMLTAAGIASAAAVCALAVCKPAILALLYSDGFQGAARFLRWTLMGDYLKASSWVLSVSLLAAADMRGFLGADLIAYAVFAAGAAALARFRGAAEATAIGFVLMYAAHLLACGWIAWRRCGFRPGARLAAIWTAGLAAVAAVSALTWERT